MKNIQLLDCTLRDGGYVNNWQFGQDCIIDIIQKLVLANIDIIECGFLNNKAKHTKDETLFNSIEEINSLLPKEKCSSQFVCMINYGEFDIDDIPSYQGDGVCGIRIVFHQNEVKEAIDFAEKIIKKGYRTYIQPMATINYSDVELLQLIKRANEISPYAVYIVDSFGVMQQKDLLRMFYLIDHNLSANIKIGYHSHNNLQLACSNAQGLAQLNIVRELLIDSSVFGMGRGAGNLNTELFVHFLNSSGVQKYNADPLLSIIDKYLDTIYKSIQWGYSLPHYLSAKHNLHPNYASYLAELNTLTVDAIDKILNNIAVEKRNNYDKTYIKDLYYHYQEKNIDETKALTLLKKAFNNKTVLIIAPGKSITSHIFAIKNKINANTPVVSVNFSPKDIDCNYAFVSNLKRFESIQRDSKTRLILTSNIISKDSDIVVDYSGLCNNNSEVFENAGLMIIKLLIKLGASKLLLAGFDGYVFNQEENYSNSISRIVTSNSQIKSYNKEISKQLQKFQKLIPIEFLTPSLYQT